MLWADSDPILPLSTAERFAEAIGRDAPEVIAGASHFLQEDQRRAHRQANRRVADGRLRAGRDPAATCGAPRRL